MNNERFTIPELLFHPSDVGIHEMGVAEAVVHTIQSLPEGQLSVKVREIASKFNCVYN